MVRKFKYNPPFAPLILGITGLLNPIFFLTRGKFDPYGDRFFTDLVFVAIGFIVGLMLTITFIRKRSSGHILVTDTLLEFPRFLGKPDRINFSDIKYVTETNPDDGLIKISTTRGFFRFKKKFMNHDDFEKLTSLLKTRFPG